MIKEDYRDLLTPDIINSVSGLALIARMVVDGFLSGRNISNRVGAGLEFSQYRGYEVGDDLRLLDWKMLARSGRYYIKQAEIDSHVTVKFVLDTSASMLHEEQGLSKLSYAKVLAAALGHLATSQGDAIGLATINENNISQLQPGISKQHFNKFLYTLVDSKASGAWPQTLSSDTLHQKSRRELLFVITDLYQKGNELTSLIKSLKTSRNEVLVLQLVGDRELNFDYKGQVIFEDLETGERRKLQVKDAKKDYLDSRQTTMTSLKNELQDHGIPIEQFQIDTHVGEALQLFLKKRSAL